jgi:hypothetical protein
MEIASITPNRLMPNPIRYGRRFIDIVKRDGLVEALDTVWLRLINFGRLPSWELKRQATLRRFDRKYRVDTAGIIDLHQLKVDAASARFGYRYGGITQQAFDELLANLDVRYENFTFVDFGSGKGAALLHASNCPFKKIVGVEFAKELHLIAQANFKSYCNPRQRCFQLESICMDAVQYQFPDGPLILLFNSPFGVEVWQRVVVNLKDSIAAAPRQIYLTLMNWGWDPAVAKLLDGVEQLTQLKSTNLYKIYRLEPPADSGATR